MHATLADVFRTFGTGYLETRALSAPQARVVRAVLKCRTAALGGQLWCCEQCGYHHFVYHSCRNRHCPACQTRTRETWTRQRLIELLPVPYAHLVFTLPHALNSLAAFHPHWVYDTLMNSAAATLNRFAQDQRWLGATPAFTLVLHTWTQDLRRHLHVHGLMSCGGLDDDDHWVGPQRNPRFLFPVHALSRVFRAKYLDALDSARRQGLLPHDPADTAARVAERRRKLLKHDWVVYAKTPLGGAAEVLAYLSRYTHRTAVSNERIVAIERDQVLLRVRADDHGGKRITRINGMDFVGRFLQHVLPPGFKRIRHYGLLSPAQKSRRLSQARAALNVPPPVPVALESAEQFMLRVAQRQIERCPCCGEGRLRLLAELLPESGVDQPLLKRLLPAESCRGPPC